MKLQMGNVSKEKETPGKNFKTSRNQKQHHRNEECF